MIRPQYYLFLTLALVLSFVGCGSDDTDAEMELPDWLSETDTDASESAEPPSPTAPALDRAALKLNLNRGDRFPLRKVVEQQLTQSSLDGQPQISRSRLEMMLAITVDDVRDGRTLMRVKYDRVQYSHEVAGELLKYDSAAPPAQIPAPVLAYHGMVNDGFAFWIGPDNQIAELVGFREFVERCLSHISPEGRQQALRDIEASAGEKGIADFVDNTIGLLPYDVDKVLGDSWEKTRHISRPVPMQINTTYTLADFNDETAEVMVGGTITPSTTLGGAGRDGASVRITVTGGSSHGRCLLYRESGLPKESRVERIVDMTVQMSGGIEFDQQKRTTTTVESFPLQTVAAGQNGPRFQ